MMTVKIMIMMMIVITMIIIMMGMMMAIRIIKYGRRNTIMPERLSSPGPYITPIQIIRINTKKIRA